MAVAWEGIVVFMVSSFRGGDSDCLDGDKLVLMVRCFQMVFIFFWRPGLVYSW